MTAPSVGIDDFSVYLPPLFLPIEQLAAARSIAYEKLNKGLGLREMAVADAREDPATMAANAVLDLMHKNDVDPTIVGRLYLGTESALDGAKPTATYVLDMLTDHFAEAYGPNCFLHCDVVDLTFACIGGVDALQNCLEWCAARDGRTGIVVATDSAKYEMTSTGEYTQGAGAVAMLVKRDPRLLRIDPDFGVATRPAHDFFKPKRKVSKQSIIREVIDMLPDLSAEDYRLDELEEKLTAGLNVQGVLDCNERFVTIHKDTPVFDGPYSNEAYQARIREAYYDYRKRHGLQKGNLRENYAALAFHLPYAYQARRMFSELYMEALKEEGNWEPFVDGNNLDVPCAEDYADREQYIDKCSEFLRQVTKTPEYQQFVERLIAPGDWASSRVGNLYSGSVFLSLMAILENAHSKEYQLGGKEILVFAYGSGSKSKVFAATVGDGWQAVVRDFDLTMRLDNRQAIDYATYEQLHRCQLSENVAKLSEGGFFLADVHDREDGSEGARHYGYKATAIAY